MMFGRYYFAQKMGDEGGEGHEQPLFVFEASKVGFKTRINLINLTNLINHYRFPSTSTAMLRTSSTSTVLNGSNQSSWCRCIWASSMGLVSR